jgi:hypothetical protein
MHALRAEVGASRDTEDLGVELRGRCQITGQILSTPGLRRKRTTVVEDEGDAGDNGVVMEDQKLRTELGRYYLHPAQAQSG